MCANKDNTGLQACKVTNKPGGVEQLAVEKVTLVFFMFAFETLNICWSGTSESKVYI